MFKYHLPGKMRMNKRGITPLVATLMLISFSVGLGAIVMAWGQQYIEEKAEFITSVQAMPAGCDPVSVKILSISGAKQICVSGQAVRAMIENGPDVAVDNLRANIVSAGGTDSVESVLQASLAPAASSSVAITHKAQGAVRQIKLIPYVTQGNKRQFCEKKAIVVEDPIAKCS